MRVAQGGVTTGEARTLLGVMAWANQCLPQTTPFTGRLWAAVKNAPNKKEGKLKVSHGLREDMQWWLTALRRGMGADGAAIIHTQGVVGVIAAGDAGTEWGIGGHDATRFYNAELPAVVRRKAQRKTRASSKYLELYQMLVMARVLGPGWKGQHVQVAVDNAALVPLFRKMRGKRAHETEMVREIALLQATDQWSWSVVWVPRERNEAADALSKDDMQRFWRERQGAACSRMEVAADHLRLPGAPVLRGGAWGRAQRMPREIFQRPGGTVQGNAVWDMLGRNLHHVEQQLPRAAHTTGVNRYLELANATGRAVADMLPQDGASMVENLKRYMMHLVMSYPYTHAATGALEVTAAVAASTAGKYADQLAAYWREYTGSAQMVHLHPSVKALKAYLRKSLPNKSKQKCGITAPMLKGVIHAIREAQGMGTMEEALFTYMWGALLRPGEAVVTQRHPAWDISRHPAVADVQFYDGTRRRHPGDGRGVPARMEACIKDSKSEALKKRRLVANVVIGATGDEDLCPVRAMWLWLEKRGAVTGAQPLFMVKDKPCSYAYMRKMLTWGLQQSGVAPEEERKYGGHSFRIGGAQALAMAGRSSPYIMAMGRWSCLESLLTYVETPMELRVQDAMDMVTARPGGAARLVALERTPHEVVAASTALASRLRSRWGV